MKTSYLKSLMIGAALCAIAGPGFAYSSTTTSGTTMVTSPSDYQTNQAAYPHENMGTVAVPTAVEPGYAAPATTTTTTTTTASSGMGNSMSGSMSSGAISNPQQIGSCLCMQQSTQSLSGQVSAKQAAYDQAVSQRATLTNQLSQERAAASTPDQVNAIRATSEKLIMLQSQINGQYIPQLQMATSQYNGVVGQYSQSCAGKTFDANAQAQVQANLQCHG